MRSSLYEVRIERLVDVGRVDIVPGFFAITRSPQLREMLARVVDLGAVVTAAVHRSLSSDMPPICRSCRSSWSTANGSAGGNCCPTRASSVASSLGNEERHQLGDLLGPSWTPDGNSSQGLHDDVTRGLFTNSPQPTSIWTKAKEASQGFVQTVDQRIRGGRSGLGARRRCGISTPAG
jgi:hypothetical protein